MKPALIERFLTFLCMYMPQMGIFVIAGDCSFVFDIILISILLSPANLPQIEISFIIAILQ
jgi:hypothetical protein